MLIINKNRIHYLILLLLIVNSCRIVDTKNNNGVDVINKIIDKWHADARDANFQEYFNRISDNGYYIGTDSSEIWTKAEFEYFAKPYFDKKKTWNFKTIKRSVYFSKDKNTAWFNELLNTWMGKCRGSGILEFENGSWKIKQYVLSITIPNTKIDKVIEIKSNF